ncbi:MAG: extracellular solute-binding protein [Abditibacteriales bacterium]|nr:extracellular solute-binding protein [Abditibacteriales bacterium]MDW8366377.1 extracellular solute-binding protein [Abditibacteriales bacterium]
MKHKLLCLVVALGGCLFLTSCGGQKEEDAAAPTTQNAKSKTSKSITIAVYDGGKDGPISGPLYHWKSRWEKETGWKLNIVGIPYKNLREKIFSDLKLGLGKYDGFIIPAYFYGDLIDGDYIVPIDKFMGDAKFPRWNPHEVVPRLMPLHKWGAQTYGVSNDGDGQIFYYRKDLLTSPQWQAEYKKATGKPMPVPPQTWEEVLSVAQFFTGKDFSGDGQPDYGLTLNLKPQDQSFNNFLAVTAAYVVNPGPKVDRYHNVYWFDPETMEPLIDSPGHLEGLKMLIALFKTAPAACKSWGLSDQWNLFLKGEAVFCFTFGDLGPLAQDVEKQGSKVRGKLGCSLMPGSKRVWSFAKKQWLTLDKPNRVGNTLGASWHGVISKFSKNPDMVYHLFAAHATRPVHIFNCTHGWTGINPIMSYDFVPPYGNGKLDDYVSAGWDKSDAQQYLNAYYADYHAPTYLEYLRIPRTLDFFDALDKWSLKAIGGEVTPEEALKNLKAEWQAVIEREGKEKLLRAYQESIGYQKAHP